VGAALAELALRPEPGQPDRRLFLAAGVIASNLPDIDLVYTGITPAPLGYLLHHRGHTHTVAGLIALALAIALVCLAPPLRRAIRSAGASRFWLLAAASLGSHLVLDSWNTYGVHPFHPVDSRWFYGDAVFIFEPWLWVLFGLAAAANARRRWSRIALGVVGGVLCAALAALGIVPVPALAALAVCGAGFAHWARHRTPRLRAAVALVASALVVAGLFSLAALARARTRATVAADPRGAIVELVVNPNPGWPLCWSVIAIEREADALVLRRGTLSLARWYSPGSCPSHQMEGLPADTGGASLAWTDELHQPLGDLRDLARRDCWVRGWLQFGRAPFVREGMIADLRFESGPRGNFTAMVVSGEERACPPAMTSWGPPRADVLSAP
jgi:inner membrane protein